MTAIRPALSLAAALLLAAAAPDDPGKADKEKLQGTWIVESLQEKGRTVDPDDIDGLVILFQGDTYRAIDKQGDEIESGTFAIDAAQTPRTIDFRIKRGPGEGKTQLGVYEFRGATLKFCYSAAGAKDRPKDFASDADAETSLLVLKKKP